MTRVVTRQSSAGRYGVGYGHLPRLGVIEALHALNPKTGLTLCDQPVAISWSADDVAGVEIDCPACLEAIDREEQV